MQHSQTCANNIYIYAFVLTTYGYFLNSSSVYSVVDVFLLKKN